LERSAAQIRLVGRITLHEPLLITLPLRAGAIARQRGRLMSVAGFGEENGEFTVRVHGLVVGTDFDGLERMSTQYAVYNSRSGLAFTSSSGGGGVADALLVLPGAAAIAFSRSLRFRSLSSDSAWLSEATVARVDWVPVGSYQVSTTGTVTLRAR
jgi:hypothetical protein